MNTIKARTEPYWVHRQKEMSKYIGKRKHCSQLTDNEISMLEKKLKEVDNWIIDSHALERLKEKDIEATYEDIVSTIYNSELIEYKIDYSRSTNRCTERVVMRGNALVNGVYNLNVVFDFTSKRIITVWLNRYDDNHYTLRFDELYSEDLVVFGF